MVGLEAGRAYISDDYLVWVVPDTERVPGPALDARLAGFMRHLRPDYVLIDSAIGCEVDSGPVWAALDKYTVVHCT